MKYEYKKLNLDTYTKLRRRGVVKFYNVWDNIPEPGESQYTIGCVHSDRFYLSRVYPSWNRVSNGSECDEHKSHYKIQRGNLIHLMMSVKLNKRGKPFIARRLKT